MSFSETSVNFEADRQRVRICQLVTGMKLSYAESDNPQQYSSAVLQESLVWSRQSDIFLASLESLNR